MKDLGAHALPAEKIDPKIVGDNLCSSGVVPPYILDELYKRDPSNIDLRRTLNQSSNLPGSSPLELQTIDEQNAARKVYDSQGRFTHPGEKARFEGEKPTGDLEVDNAYDYSGTVRDFYTKEFGRNSIDNNGMDIISSVNYGQNFSNAYWNGSQMVYGRPFEKSPFKSFVLLDLCGHEVTHGVTEAESHLNYYGQAGALNESLSDVFGSMIKQYSRHQTAAQADWIIGEGIWKDYIHGRGFRDLLNPGTAYDDPKVGKDPQPANMKDYIKMVGDYGGAHYNSGIPNRAFALFAEAVGGYAWEDPGHIWFAACKAAGQNLSFAQFAYHTIEQAKALGHADEVEKLENAWDAVGVTPSATATDTDTPKHPLRMAG